MSKSKRILKKVKNLLKTKKHWKKRDLNVLDRYINQRKKKPLTIVQYIFGDLDEMEKDIARKKYFKKNNQQKH